jgi:ankyrin repeat protein
MAATPGFRSRPTADDRIYRAVAAGKSADDVRRAIERSRAVVPGSTAQQQRAAAVNQAGQTGETPLQGNAHRQWRGDLVGLLLENGADTAGLFEARQITPLAVAVAYGLVDTVRALLTAGHDANENFYYKDCTAVHWCVARAPLSPAPNYDYPLNCHPRLNVLKVLEGHADVNARDAYGRTPLHWLDPDDTRDAINAALDLLVSLGADVNARDKYPFSHLRNLAVAPSRSCSG